MNSRTTIWHRFRGWFGRESEPRASDVPVTVISPAAAKKMRLCEKRLGYRFKDQQLLKVALTHTSGAAHKLLSNERLEFFGDAILGQVISEWLFCEYPRYLEGELTRIKSVIVSRKTCADIASKLAVREFVIVGKGIGANGTIPESILSNAIESLVAALYLDGGSVVAREFIRKHFTPLIQGVVSDGVPTNYKSQFQQVAQRDFKKTPVYYLQDEKGPDHQKEFYVYAAIDQQQFLPGWGKSKKEAEQMAAYLALIALGEIADSNETTRSAVDDLLADDEDKI